jgi:hypothetical protein
MGIRSLMPALAAHGDTLWDPGEALATLRAAVDRLIPADEFPAAWAAGAGHYLLRQLAGDAAALVPVISTGLLALEAEAHARHGSPFATLDAAQQDAVLADVEGGTVQAAWPVPPQAFFAALLALTNEGYYGDPGNGGNREMVSWKMIGYRPGPAPKRQDA